MLLGGKGANLCEMTQIGLNVPPGFVITTQACLDYLQKDALPDGLMADVRRHITGLEAATGKSFGSADNPLLVSVRSGSAMSMPGMMDTILNLGLNDRTIDGLIKQTGNDRFAYDSYRRLIQLFGKIALGVADEHFDERMNAVKSKYGLKLDVELTVDHLKELCNGYFTVIRQQTGESFPQDPYEQLEISVQAVFRSWNGRRAVDYRRQFKITPAMANGTAVNICTMVFGNMGNDCATGVGFTRNPGTGENAIYGEYLTNAQGEDVVAGIRTPKPIGEMAVEMPEIYRQLMLLRHKLETHYKEVQDFEFTIERGTLYCLQTRNGKMNARAMVRTSVEMYESGLIERERAILRIEPMLLEQLLAPRLSPEFKGAPLVKGLPASPGAASGLIVFDADTAQERGEAGEKIILVREETKPEDIHGFFAAQGILTSRGGKTSHAAVVARGMGKPCVSGCEEIEIDVDQKTCRAGAQLLAEGDTITIDGTTGCVYFGEIPTIEAEFFDDLATLLAWADEIAEVKVMANAETAKDVSAAKRYGAMGIGLCRTERMFNDVTRLPIVQQMILAESVEQRTTAIEKLLPMQRNDFKIIFTKMSGKPVTVRLLDPPLHEFLPSQLSLEGEVAHLKHLYDRDMSRNVSELTETLKIVNPDMHKQYIKSLAGLQTSLEEVDTKQAVRKMLDSKQVVLNKVKKLSEVNPMLGHRGVRLGITFPEIYQMQIRAILEAIAECTKEGVDVKGEIMVPQVVTAEELRRVSEYVKNIHADVEQTYGVELKYKFGTMIETVRACMRAGRLAEIAEFFSFGTNDLTQATFSFSREDAENKFLPMYTERGILHDNPFEILDLKGVGRIMDISVTWGRKTRPDLKVGICGEQGGHPDSVRFCHHIKLNYVSCSPPRVPIARLAAAHAKLLEKDYVYV
jgi:pyruvate,orthophosphate dikinase